MQFTCTKPWAPSPSQGKGRIVIPQCLVHSDHSIDLHHLTIYPMEPRRDGGSGDLKMETSLTDRDSNL